MVTGDYRWCPAVYESLLSDGFRAGFAGWPADGFSLNLATVLATNEGGCVMFSLPPRAALIMAVMSDGRMRTKSEIDEAVDGMSGDQQVAAIQDWLPILGGYRMEDDDL